jgi:DGQHR domain-containing protein
MMQVTTVKDVANNQYFKVPLMQFTQKEQSFYVAKINASDFLKIYTVRPAEYDLEKHTSFASSFPDESEYYSHLIREDKQKINSKDFQREPDDTRISKISNFLKDEEYAFFPNTIIANCELINDIDDISIDEDTTEEYFLHLNDKPKTVSFFNKIGSDYYLYIPDQEKTVLVIDGQHRLEGLKKADKDIQSQYDLIITFLIGFDRSIIAKQFYTINYEQKSVNKSLLYQLTGEFSRNIDELTFMHNVVKLLNELTESPFYGRIKMLGKAPKYASQDEKNKLSISQAFMIDSTIRFISANAKGSTSPPIFLKYFKNKEEHIHIIRVLSRYFNAVSKIKPEWNSPKESIISKGMGVTALLRVLNILFPIIFINELNSDWTKIDNLKIEDYVRILSGLENVDFGTDGPYGKTGSAGSIAKIKNDILSKLQYINTPADTKDFEQNTFINYTLRFNDILKNID